MSRIGIFGGSFNPPHLGHILALREFQQKLSLDAILLNPAAVPPHKKLSANSPTPEQRLAMCRLAVKDLPFVTVSDLELKRTGLSYTADTVEILRKQYPMDELFLLMGTDMFLSFENWYQPERITKAVTLAVAHRNKDKQVELNACAQRLTDKFCAKTVQIENSFLPHSSTSVRAMLAFGAGESYVTSGVYRYIQENQLYYVEKELKNLPFDQLSEISLSLLNPKRVNHVLGCSKTSYSLALQYGANPTDAERSGILHDITKALNAEEQLKLCDTYAIILDNFEQNHPKLLHARTGAVIAERVFGENIDVCQAIRWHTTGKADMSTLEKILYVADYIEPNRDFDGVEELRRLTNNNLNDALYLGLRMTTEQLTARNAEIGPNTLAAIRFLEERTRSHETNK